MIINNNPPKTIQARFNQSETVVDIELRDNTSPDYKEYCKLNNFNLYDPGDVVEIRLTPKHDWMNYQLVSLENGVYHLYG